ncbi:hypothetical protein Peur_067684 [Populus x canadensis]
MQEERSKPKLRKLAKDILVSYTTKCLETTNHLEQAELEQEKLAPSSGGTGSGSSKGGGSMKAPGQDFRISRDGFEKNPAGYFRDLHKK